MALEQEGECSWLVWEWESGKMNIVVQDQEPKRVSEKPFGSVFYGAIKSTTKQTLWSHKINNVTSNNMIRSLLYDISFLKNKSHKILRDVGFRPVIMPADIESPNPLRSNMKGVRLGNSAIYVSSYAAGNLTHSHMHKPNHIRQFWPLPLPIFCVCPPTSKKQK
jgi:hypothetical protein